MCLPFWATTRGRPYGFILVDFSPVTPVICAVLMSICAVTGFICVANGVGNAAFCDGNRANRVRNACDIAGNAAFAPGNNENAVGNGVFGHVLCNFR